MAVVTHGLKDGIDQILEITRSLERSLDGMDEGSVDSARRQALQDARQSVSDLKSMATESRSLIELLRRTKA